MTRHGLILLLMFALALPAHAATDAGKKLADEAAALFKEGKFLQAAELFERSYALSPDKLVRLRNAGRAYEDAGRLEYARLVFQRYLDLAPEGPDKQEVRDRVARLDDKLKPKPAPVVAPPPPEPKVAPPVVQQAAPSHTLGWSLIGVGGAAIAGGTTWLVLTAKAAAQLDDDDAAGFYDYPNGGRKRDEDRDTLHTNRVLAWSTLGLGVAAAGYGVYDLMRKPAATVAAVPWTGPGTAGLTLAGRF